LPSNPFSLSAARLNPRPRGTAPVVPTAKTSASADRGAERVVETFGAVFDAGFDVMNES
jgi:hypothetical protein